MLRTSPTIAFMALLIVGGNQVQARDGETEFDLVGTGEHVVRTMQVIGEDGAPVYGLMDIVAFDRNAAAFDFRTPVGTRRIPASQIKSLRFAQTTRSLELEQPWAQVPAWDVKATRGETWTETVTIGELAIDDGVLTLRLPDELRGEDPRLRIEVEEITFEAAGEGSKSPEVKILLRPVTYERVIKGGGGPPGMTKPLQ
jgi:hypothetical protein